MKTALLKRQFCLWGFTFAGIALLFVTGLVVSFWIGGNPSQGIRLTMDGLQLGWWRAVIYSVLLLFWSRLISWVIPGRQYLQQYPASRRPLIVLIVLYECLIVQNPLAVLFGWVG